MTTPIEVRGRGFTLVEVLVALVGASLLSGALMALLMRQSRFQIRVDETVHAEQTVRVLADGMAAELRGASSQDILRADPDGFGIRFDVARAVVCDTVAGGGADLFAYDTVPAPNVPPRFRGTAVSGPYDGPFTYADGFVPGSSPSAAAEGICRARGADSRGMAPSAAFRRTTGWTAAFGSLPVRGSVVRTYGALTYTLAPSGSQSGAVSVRRNGQEYATPLAAGAGFEYVMADGTIRSQVGSGNFLNVREVRLVATAMGRTPGVATRSVVYEMPLRN